MTDPVSTERLEEMLAAAKKETDDSRYTIFGKNGYYMVLAPDEVSAILTELLAARQAPEGVRVTSEWHRDDGDQSILLYTLKQDGWRHGQPAMVNDVTVRIENAPGSDHDLAPIADAILSAIEPVTQTVSEEMTDTAAALEVIARMPSRPVGPDGAEVVKDAIRLLRTAALKGASHDQP